MIHKTRKTKKKHFFLLFLLILFLFSVYISYADENDILCFYSFDNGEYVNHNPIDLSHNGYNGSGTSSGITTNVSGHIGQAFDLDGAYGQVNTTIPYSFFDDDDDYSIVIGVYSDDLSSQKGIFGNLYNSNEGINLFQRNNGSAFVVAVYDKTNETWVYSNYTITSNWTLYYFIHNGTTKKTEIYANNNLILTLSSHTYTNNEENLVIGTTYPSFYSSQRFDGKIDLFYFYNTTINENERNKLWNNGSWYSYYFEISLNEQNEHIYRQNQNITFYVYTRHPAICKYAHNNTWDFNTEGYSMNGNNTEHNITLDMSSFEYGSFTRNYYKCNITTENYIVNSTKNHYWFVANWTNTFLMTGDSVLVGYSCVNNNTRASYFVPQYLSTLDNYLGITEINTGIGGSCLSDYGSCASHNPLVNRTKVDIINHNPRFIYIMPDINDNHYDVPVNEYISDFNQIVDDILVNDTNATLIVSTLTGHSNDLSHNYDQPTSAEYNAKLRESAIIRKIPFFEWHYITNHNSSLRCGGDIVHLNQIGHQLLNETIVDVVLNEEDYIMNTSKWNFYHDCNNAVSVLNYTFLSSTMNCEDNTSADWLVILNITNNSFYIKRADKPFVINISSQYEPNTSYTITAGYDKQYINSTANGSLLNISFNSYNDTLVTIEETTSICGDGIVSGDEECDGSNLNNQTCASFGFDAGFLSCSSSCNFDTSTCQLSYNQRDWLYKHTKSYYKFDEDIGDYFNLFDFTEQHDGYISSAQKVVNKSYYFNYSTLEQDAMGVHNMDTGTIIFWFYLNSTIPRTLFSYQPEDTNSHSTIEFQFNTHCISYSSCISIFFIRKDGLSYDIWAEVPLTENITQHWHQLIYSVSNSGNRIWFDGVLRPDAHKLCCGSSMSIFFSDYNDANLLSLQNCAYTDEFAILNTTSYLNQSYVDYLWNNGNPTYLQQPPYNTTNTPHNFYCGDGLVTGREQCDGSNLNGNTCNSFGYDSGSLSCSGSCTFNTSDCYNKYYSADDIPAGIFDGLAKFIIALGSMAGVIVLIFGFNYVKTSLKGNK